MVIKLNTHTHSVSIVDRNVINITGVIKVENFDKTEFLIESSLGFINIKGENLEMIKLDTLDGNVSIKGKNDSMIYLENVKHKKGKEESVISRLFK